MLVRKLADDGTGNVFAQFLSGIFSVQHGEGQQ